MDPDQGQIQQIWDYQKAWEKHRDPFLDLFSSIEHFTLAIDWALGHGDMADMEAPCRSCREY